MNDFNFIIPLQKSTDGEVLTGVASALSVDRDEERMGDEALDMMAKDIKELGVNLFGNHEHNWENILGGIDNATVMNKKLQINIHPNKANPKYPQLIGTMSTKGVRLGLSVGGNVESYSWEYNRDLNKKIKVLDRVKIYEVSVVGIASNADAFLTIPMAIAKSAKLPRTCPLCFAESKDKRCSVCLTVL